LIIVTWPVRRAELPIDGAPLVVPHATAVALDSRTIASLTFMRAALSKMPARSIAS
jgi:hypothetical protein